VEGEQAACTSVGITTDYPVSWTVARRLFSSA
jgi:hypothetical protein